MAVMEPQANDANPCRRRRGGWCGMKNLWRSRVARRGDLVVKNRDEGSKSSGSWLGGVF